jgi:hypothetical protein
MKYRELLKWVILAYLLTLAMFIFTMRMLPASADNVIANFAKFMISQFYPLFVIAPVLAVYSICVRRWQPILGGFIGNLAFVPITMTLGIPIAFVITGPFSAWHEGWHLVAVLLVAAYMALVWLLVRRFMKHKDPNKASVAIGADAPQQQR